MGGHPFPAGTLAFGCLFAAALLLLRNDTNRHRTPMNARLDLQSAPQMVDEMGPGVPGEAQSRVASATDTPVDRQPR